MSKRKKVAVFATEPVTGRLGGLGIRQLQVARTLAKFFEVRLFTEYRVERHREPFQILQIDYEQSHTLEEPVRWADVVYSSQPAVAPFTKKFGKPVAVDLLVHEYFEDLEFLPLETMEPLEQSVYFSDCILRLSRQLDMGDFFLCSNERERDFYLGVLTLLGKLIPGTYQTDPQFRFLIDVAPFGLPKREPKKGKNILRGEIPGIGPRDFLIVWGGSLANWFDSLTPVRAMARLKKTCPRAKLVFVGNKHPVPAEQPSAFQKTVNLAKRRGLYGKNVFFYTDWVPYDRHDYYLTEADAGMVAFHDHLENHFSFRIRVVDYFWADLPVLTNPGNVLSRLIESKNMGKVFPFGDDKSLAEAIEWMAAHRAGCRKMRQDIAREKKQFHWDRVLAPLIDFCRSPRKAATLFDGGRLPELEQLKKQRRFTPEQLLRLVPSHPYMRLMLARKSILENKPQKAASLINDHLRLFGYGLETELFRLPLLDVPGDFTYEEILRLVPSHPYSRLMRARLKMNESKFPQAGKLIEEEIELFGETAEALFCRGLLRQRLGEHRKAVADFERVRREMPERIDCWLPLAGSLAELGDTKQAKKLYAQAWNKAQGRGGEGIRARVAAAMAKLEAPRRPEHETWALYEQRDPCNEALAYAHASALERAGKTGEARSRFASFTKIFRNEKIRAGAWFRLARLSPQNQRGKMLRAALKLDPSHSAAREMLRQLRNNAD
ncbi:MAG: tetratricopeptide repeat protein [Nitrospinales bacterium]